MDKMKQSKGFTLIEMAIVIIIIGVAIAGMTPLYTRYQENQRIEKTSVNVNAAISAIGNFRSLHGRYPCPSSLTIDRTDPNYGREDCTDHTATAVGDCDNGICIEQSKRAALTYQYPWGTPHNQKPRVLVGFIPFRHLNLDEKQAYDGYQDRIMYVVTEHLTCDNCFKSDQGGIDVVDDSGDSVLKDMGTAHFMVFSYGANKAGAYTASGTRIACTAGGTLENENCDYSTSAADADATYQVAQTSTSQGNSNFDDVVNYFTQDEIPLWQMSTAQQYAIHPKPGGDIAINKNPAGDKAEIGGTVRVAVDAAAPPNSTGLFKIDELCTQGSDDCWPTTLIAGNIADAVGGMKCPEDDTVGGTGQFMVGIENGQPVCEDQLTSECPTGSLMTGVNPDGTLRCDDPPPDPCPSTTVSICSGITSTIPAAAHGVTYTVTAGTSRQRTYRCDDGTWRAVGSASGSCTCTAGVVSTTSTACGEGFTGNQITTVTRVCPAGTQTTTVNRGACVCDPVHQTSTRACPTGWTGSIATQRDHICPADTWTAWTDTVGGNTCTCTDSMDTRTVSCPTGLTGTGIQQQRTRTCIPTGITIGSWTEVSRDCTCTPTTQTQPFPCPSGYTGSIMRTRNFVCGATTGSWTSWTDVVGGNTCEPIPPVVCNWNSSTTAQGPYPFTKGVSMEDPCDCGQTSECYSRVGTGSYMHYSVCSCE